MGEECPKETTSTRKHYTTSTTEECPKETTTTKRHTTPKRTTTTEECPKETTSTRKHYTSSTTTRKHHSTTSEKCDEKKKQCYGGQWSDDDGCCPRKIGHQWYYRDAHGCYPVERDCGGVYYADAKGC